MSATVHLPRLSTSPARPDRRPRRLAVVGVPVLVASCLLSTATAASAAPAMSDPTGCTTSLAPVKSWPGTLAGTRLVSDALYTHLLSQPACVRLEA